MPKSTPTLVIYTDGACSGNPGPGGWAALIRDIDNDTELVGKEQETTNNRMELMAAIASLEHIKTSTKIDLFTDSEYVKKGITEWMPKWISNDWKTSTRKPVKNRDLWERLNKALRQHDVTLHWVKAHNNHPENERVDRLARQQARLVVSPVP